MKRYLVVTDRGESVKKLTSVAVRNLEGCENVESVTPISLWGAFIVRMSRLLD